MGRIRAAVNIDRVTMADTFSRDIELKGYAAISAIDVLIRATNGATSNTAAPIHTDIDSISVLDGSQVLFSLTGQEVKGLNCYELGKHAPAVLTQAAAGVQEETFRVHFGRFLGDDEYYMVPSRYQNPILRVQGSMTISATVGFATATTDMTAIVHTWDQAPAGRKGMLITKEYKSFTSAASGDDVTDLPRDFPFVRLMVRSLETSITFETDITRLKLSANGQGIVYFDHRTEWVRDQAIMKLGPIDIDQRLLSADAEAEQTYLAWPRWAHITPLADLDVGGVEAITADQATVGLYLLSATPTIAKDATARALALKASGYGPFNTLWLPICDPMDPSEWLDPAGLQQLQLTLTQGGAGATTQVFGQQAVA